MGNNNRDEGLEHNNHPPPPHNNNRKPRSSHPTPAPPGPPSAVPLSRIPNAPYMALFGKEYDCLAHVMLIAGWKLSVEKKRLELCSGLKMSLNPGKPTPTGSKHVARYTL